MYLPCSCGTAKFLGDARKLPSFDSDSKELNEYLEAAVLGHSGTPEASTKKKHDLTPKALNLDANRVHDRNRVMSNHASTPNLKP